MNKLIPILTQIGPRFMRKLWLGWNIRAALVFSLLLQIFLTLTAPNRMSTRRGKLFLLIWIAYLTTDAVANFAIGLITNSQHNQSKSSRGQENKDLLSLWAPFLLLHLGCPDTITAFELADNDLWKRHLLSLLLQAAAALYVFIQSLPGNQLKVPTLFMFIAGIIKYTERSHALYHANFDRFRDSMLEKPDPGPDYAKLMERYGSTREANVPARIDVQQEPDRDHHHQPKSPGDRLTDLEVVQYAFQYFGTFKGLVVDLVFNFREREEIRQFFFNRDLEDALKLLEVELNLIYRLLYTKANILHTRVGFLFKFFAFGSISAALGFFYFKENKNQFNHLDVQITYTLLVGAIALEVTAILYLIFSDPTIAHYKDPRWPLTVIFQFFLKRNTLCWHPCTSCSGKLKHELLATPRWSGSISTYNLIGYCLKKDSEPLIHRTPSYWLSNINIVKKMLKPSRSEKEEEKTSILDCVSGWRWMMNCNIVKQKLESCGIKKLWDEIKYVCSEPLTKDLWNFTFKELKKKSEFADTPEVAAEISSARGEWVLMDVRVSDSKLMKYVRGLVEYDESLVLWHIATDLCYHTSIKNHQLKADDEEENSPDRLCSKILSDYMLYLLVFKPSTMNSVAGIAKIRLQDTCADAERFFKRREWGCKSDYGDVCADILAVPTDVEPVSLKGGKSKSLLFDASMLAKELRGIKASSSIKWEIVSRVWVELLSYAATHCKSYSHAQQVTQGGELLNFVWLLMAHFSLGHHFLNRNMVAKLILGK